MDGIFINGRRPKSKKEIREMVAAGENVVLESTSMYDRGLRTGGPVSELPDGSYPFVGPDPFTSRKFYGTLTVRGGVGTVK